MTTLARGRRIVAPALAAATATALLTLGATPASGDILIEFDELIFGQTGSVQTVAEAAVPSDLVGSTCEISVIAANQASVHPGNDLIVSTGDSQVVIPGVEDEANGGTTAVSQLVVGPTIVVQLRFGEDEISSLGFDLSFDCTAAVTTTAPEPTTTTAPGPSESTTTAGGTDPSLDGQQVGQTTAPTVGGASTTAPDSGGDGGDQTTVPTSVPAGAAAQEGDGSSSTLSSTTAPSGADGSGAPSTTTTAIAPPATTGPAPTEATSADATDDLPPSPVARAIVAAPAYAG